MKRQRFVGGRGLVRPLASRLSELSNSGKPTQPSVQQRETLAFTKACVEKKRTKHCILTGLKLLLSENRDDPGATLLAEYVATRSKLSVKNPRFCNKGNPLWVLRGRAGMKLPGPR